MKDTGASSASPLTASESRKLADYEAEDDHRALTRAAEITGSPKRMAGAKKHQRKLQRQIGAVGRALGGGKR